MMKKSKKQLKTNRSFYLHCSVLERLEKEGARAGRSANNYLDLLLLEKFGLSGKDARVS